MSASVMYAPVRAYLRVPVTGDTWFDQLKQKKVVKDVQCSVEDFRGIVRRVLERTALEGNRVLAHFIG